MTVRSFTTATSYALVLVVTVCAGTLAMTEMLNHQLSLMACRRSPGALCVTN